MTHRVVVPVAVAGAVLALAAVSGCSGDPDVASTAAPTTTVPTNLSPVLQPTPEFRGQPRGVIGDVEVESCSTDPGTVRATGRATNDDDRKRDIVVTVSWATPGAGDVLARGSARLNGVPAGETRTWEVETTLDGRTEVDCVTSALRGRLKR